MNKNKIIFEWHSLLKDIIKNIWVIALCGLIGFFGAKSAIYLFYTPEYTSTATLIVNSGSGYSSYSTSTEIADIYTNIFSLDLLFFRTISQSNLVTAHHPMRFYKHFQLYQ